MGMTIKPKDQSKTEDIDNKGIHSMHLLRHKSKFFLWFDFKIGKSGSLGHDFYSLLQWTKIVISIVIDRTERRHLQLDLQR